MARIAPIFGTPIPDHRQAPVTEGFAVGAILAASTAAVAFLLWLLYFHDPSPALAQQWVFLPQLNALLNGLSAVALWRGPMPIRSCAAVLRLASAEEENRRRFDGDVRSADPHMKV